MEDTVDKVAERLAKLEETVAQGFFANSDQFKRIETRFEALDSKIDISVESLRGDIKTVLDAVGGLASELRRTTEAIRKEHAADREILKLALKDHTIRLQATEEGRRSL